MLVGIQMKKKMYFVSCPICGGKLIKAAEIDRAELHCAKCHELIGIEMMMQNGNIEFRHNQKSKIAYTRSALRITLHL